MGNKESNLKSINTTYWRGNRFPEQCPGQLVRVVAIRQVRL